MLHEREMREFLAVWRRAKSATLVLPATEDPAYISLEALLHHVLGCGRGYMVWMCEVLGLPDPDIRPAPDPQTIAQEAEAYLGHLAGRWATPLRDVEEERFYRPEHPTRWKTLYCVDAMLEHAVMHPLRHRFQLEKLLSR